MSHLSFTQTHQNALRELDRLTEIRNRLAGSIVELQSLNNPSSQTWISIYSDRLKENVLPAIEEVKAYLTSQDQQVTKASN